MIVEDDVLTRELVQETLEAEGIEVTAATSAEAALPEILRRPPDLILMDFQLPGIDGLQFTRELKALPETADIPVLAMTGNAMPLFERAAAQAGCSGFVTKPISPTLLRAKLLAFLETLGSGE